MRIATFNVQNMRLRMRDGAPRLDGARDRDADEDAGADALDPIDRRLTAAVLRAADADVVALQEVFDQATLDHFHDAWLAPAGAAPYPFRHCLPGNDGRGLDVALMSRLPPLRIQSHAAETPRSLGVAPPPGIDPDAPLFRRDCLEARIGALTLFVCHFKAPWPDPERAAALRRAEAAGLRRLIERRFAEPARALWLALGDMNEPAGLSATGALAPLADGFCVDLLERLPEDERWTWASPDGRGAGRPDAMLASPALAARWPQARPRIIRAGLDRLAGPPARSGPPRFAQVGPHRPHASDHAAVVIDLPGAETQTAPEGAP
ncbi:endonuclease/exonuclease/phosphatase family protein [Oceanicella actignis]|uniref:endonuclease/exonuclease/phosphatase family protein n=1 Tax=Oceanicella actignis TaxID=1189325 RepID=UPI0011E64E78|nr:endonuclease/exonuclease/phosphatase family protein [Oceanicella actignis]TYO90703.1 exonuclease III [Oceanicella actignis]